MKRNMLSPFAYLILATLICCMAQNPASCMGYYDTVFLNNSSWTTSTINTTDGFVSICADGGTSNPSFVTYFANAKNSGRFSNSGSAFVQQDGLSTTSFNVLSPDHGFSNVFFAAANNNLYEVGDWTSWTTRLLTSGVTYTSFTCDQTDAIHEGYGVWSGGLNYLYSTGTWPNYHTVTINTNSYTLVVNDSAAHVIYAARTGGGLDCIYAAGNIFTSSGWTTVTIDTTPYQYVTLAHDCLSSNVVYGALGQGGINRISKSGSTWQVQRMSNLIASSLASDPGQAGVIYAATPCGLYQLIWSPSSSVLLNKKAYTTLISDGTHSNRIFGYNANTSPSYLNNIILYEISPDTLIAPATYDNLTTRIPYIAGLGCTGIYILPVTKISSGLNVGVTNDQYDVEAHDQIETRRGTLQDFQNFVTTAHNNQVKVFADAVPHGAEDGPNSDFGNYWMVYDATANVTSALVVDYPSWFKWDNSDFGYGNPHMIGTWYLADFDWTQAGLRNYWTNTWVNTWVVQCNLDGIRCDMEPTGSGYTEWSAVRTACANAGHPISIISEAPNSRENAYDFEQVGIGQHPNFAALEGMSFTNLVRWGWYLPDNGSDQYYSIQISSHDTGSWANLTAQEWAYYGLFSPFIPHWYQGEEITTSSVSADIGDYDGRLNWDIYASSAADNARYNQIAQLIHIRQSNGSIINEYPTDHRTTNMLEIPTSGSTVNSYARYDGKGNAIVVGCLEGASSGTITMYLTSSILQSMNMGAYSSFTVSDLVANTTSTLTLAQLSNGLSIATNQSSPIVLKISGWAGSPQAPDHIAFSQSSYVDSVGLTIRPTVAVCDSTGAAINGANVVVVADDPSVAIVQTDGSLLGVGVGTANVHARFGSVEAYAPLTVYSSAYVNSASQVSLNLTPYFNGAAFSTEIQSTSGVNSWCSGGGQIFTLPSTELPASTTVNGVTYQFGSTASGQNNIVNCTGQTISIPNYQLAYISMIANYVNYTNPEQVQILYQDGSSATIPFQMPIYYSVGKYDVIGWQCDCCYTNLYTSAYSWRGEDKGPKLAYNIYSPVRTFFPDLSKTVSGIVLPNDSYMKVLAITIGKNTLPYSPPPVLTAVVKLNNFIGDSTLMNLRVDVRNSTDTMTIASQLVVPNQPVSGTSTTTVSFPTLANGNYLVRASSCEWLTNSAPVTVASGGTSTVNLSLLNGDINGDNFVEDQDYSILGEAWYKGGN